MKKSGKCGAAALLLAALVMAFFFGMLSAFPLAVATGSMEPAIEIGDAVVIGRTDAEALQEGQVIAYWLRRQRSWCTALRGEPKQLLARYSAPREIITTHRTCRR